MKPATIISPVSESADKPRNRFSQNPPRVIAITSGRRGIGQSTVVVLLGLALQGLGQKVLLVDAALGQASMHRYLGITPLFGIADVMAGRRSLAEAIVKSPCGLEILPAVPSETEVGEMSQGHKLLMLQELEECAGGFDFLLVDTGAGLAEHVLYFNMGAQERLVLADEEPASVIDAYTLIKVLANRYAEKRFQVLFTRISRPEVAQSSFAQLLKVADRFLHGTVSLGYLGTIPFDAAIVAAALRQQPLGEVGALSPAGGACAQLAQTLMVQEADPAMDGNMKFFWQNLHKRAASAFCQGASREGQLCSNQ